MEPKPETDLGTVQPLPPELARASFFGTMGGLACRLAFALRPSSCEPRPMLVISCRSGSGRSRKAGTRSKSEPPAFIFGGHRRPRFGGAAGDLWILLRYSDRWCRPVGARCAHTYFVYSRQPRATLSDTRAAVHMVMVGLNRLHRCDRKPTVTMCMRNRRPTAKGAEQVAGRGQKPRSRTKHV